MVLQKLIARCFTKEDGMSLIAVALLTALLGLFISSGTVLYSSWKQTENSYTTNEKLKVIQDALQNYLANNGRYPCPASLTTAVDAAGFGIEVDTDCTNGAIAGTFRANGVDGNSVRTGAVPVRTLNISDDYIYDGHKQRFIYAITEDYAVAGSTVTGNRGDISIKDPGGLDSTSQEGNIVQIVYSMGRDTNGAYDIDGNLISACDDTLASGQNCDFATNATFVNTVNKSQNDANLFTAKVTYPPSKTIITCADSGASAPKNAGFIVDTSGSMGSGGFCPMGGSCKRIHDAQWALRRVMLSRLHNNTQDSDPGSTSLTGFVGYNTAANVENNFGNIVFDDPTAPGYTPPSESDALATLETEMQGMCPSGITPLGIHMRAMADRIGNGDPDRPNKIIILSDGISNNGTDPLTVAYYIQTTYPNLQVDIVDVVGTPSLEQVAAVTGGSYFRTDDPDTLLDALRAAAGICTDYTPTIPTDTNHC